MANISSDSVLKKTFYSNPLYNDKKLSYRRVTARCVLSVVILPITHNSTETTYTTNPDQTGGAENAGVENAGVIKYGKPSKHKTVRCLMPPNLGYTLH